MTVSSAASDQPAEATRKLLRCHSRTLAHTRVVSLVVLRAVVASLHVGHVLRDLSVE